MKKMRKRNFLALVLFAALILPLPASAVVSMAAALPAPEGQGAADASPAPEAAALAQALPAAEEPESAQALPAAEEPEQTLPTAAGAGLALPASAAVETVFPRSALAAVSLMRTAPVMAVSQAGGSHVSYISGTDGLFFPERYVTRAELAQALAAIVADVPQFVSELYDVSWGTGDISAIQKVVGLGLMLAPNGFFRPNDTATRAECAYALSMMLPYTAQNYRAFPDVQPGHWAYDAISRGGGCGLFAGDGQGYFYPDAGLQRCALVVMFNRLLGRSPDQAFMSQLPAIRFFSDVPATHWAYWDILEATVAHTCRFNANGGESWLWADVKFQEDGPYRTNGRLFWIQNGEFVRNQSVGSLYFDANGCYTTGNAELDTRLNNIIETYTNSSMTRDQKLRVLFNYLRDSYTYLKRPLISKGQTGWEPEYALYFLNNGRGNCYNFSATYCLLCRELGLPAYTVVGSALNSPHGWVEIELDGTVYLFDTQLAWRYLHNWGMQGYNFFKMPIYNTTVQYTR